MSFTEPLRRRLRRHVAQPQRQQPDPVLAELAQCHAEALERLRRPYDQDAPENAIPLGIDPECPFTVSASHLCTRRDGRPVRAGMEDCFLKATAALRGPTEADVARVIDAAQRFVGGEA